MRPGLTGWAQVHGRAELAWPDRIELDVWYVEHRSPALDLRILLRTPWRCSAGRTGVRPAAGAAATTERRAGRPDRYPLSPMTAVLFTCAGQRVDIVSAFRRAGALTIATDNNELAPTLYHADQWALVPRVTDEAYVPALAELVRRHEIRLVVPLTDLDQELLSRSRDALAPALVLVPEPSVCETMGDKYLAHRFFVEHGIASPRSWLPEEVPGRRPLSRARQGAGGVRLAPHLPCSRPGRAAFFLGYTTVDSFVQEACLGEEFSIDVFCDLERALPQRDPAHHDPVEGRRVDQGHVDQGPRADRARRHVAERIGIVGPANIQCFREPDGSLPITDVNPRFGGAFPLPLAAGSRYPELALALARGESPEPRLGDFREGIVMTRFFSDLCLTRDGEGLVPFAEELPSPLAAEPGET